MASLLRRIQRGAKRNNSPRDYVSRGSKLGVHNSEAADLVARLEREKKNVS